MYYLAERGEGERTATPYCHKLFIKEQGTRSKDNRQICTIWQNGEGGTDADAYYHKLFIKARDI